MMRVVVSGKVKCSYPIFVTEMYETFAIYKCIYIVKHAHNMIN